MRRGSWRRGDNAFGLLFLAPPWLLQGCFPCGGAAGSWDVMHSGYQEGPPHALLVTVTLSSPAPPWRLEGKQSKTHFRGGGGVLFFFFVVFFSSEIVHFTLRKQKQPKV